MYRSKSSPTQRNLFTEEEDGKFSEPLLGGKSDDFGVTTEDLWYLFASPIYFSDMFHPDNIKNKQAGTQLSISLYKYWRNLKGPKGLAMRLKTDLRKGIEENPDEMRERG